MQENLGTGAPLITGPGPVARTTSFGWYGDHLPARHNPHRIDLLDSAGVPVGSVYRLCNFNLPLTATAVTSPLTYNRQELEVGHIHFGPGKLFKSLIAPFAHDHMSIGGAQWRQAGILAVTRSEVRGVPLRGQDGLYSLLERGPGRDVIRIIGSVVGCIFGDREGEELLRRMINPTVRVVSFTISKGYPLKPNGGLDLDAEHVMHDLVNPKAPRTTLGFIVEALRQRREAQLPPFSVYSFDNLPRNGDITQSLVCEMAGRNDRSLAQWIDENVSFPNTSVDRITPDSGQSDHDMVISGLGVLDGATTVTEPFRRLVVQSGSKTSAGKFLPANLPPWAENGAAREGLVVCEDVDAHAIQKLRMVNTPHMIVGWLGTRMGCKTVADVMKVPGFSDFLRGAMVQELAAAIPNPGTTDVAAYADQIVQRFKNDRMTDGLNRLNNHSSTKIPERVIEPLLDAAVRQVPYDSLSLTLASWMLSWRLTDERGFRFSEPEEKNLALRTKYLQAARLESAAEIVGAFWELEPIFGRITARLGTEGADRVKVQIASNISKLLAGTVADAVAGGGGGTLHSVAQNVAFLEPLNQ